MDDKLQVIDEFPSQKHKHFLSSSAIRGLAGHRAVQSRLNSAEFVECFEVMKLCFGQDLNLLKLPMEKEPDTLRLSIDTRDTDEYLCKYKHSLSTSRLKALQINTTETVIDKIGEYVNESAV